jgi:hypothetical protein
MNILYSFRNSDSLPAASLARPGATWRLSFSHPAAATAD